jgi:hypothetical protein
VSGQQPAPALQPLDDIRRLQDGRLLGVTRAGADIVLDVAYVRGLVPHRSVAGHTEYESARLDFGYARLVCVQAHLVGGDPSAWSWLAGLSEHDPERTILWAELEAQRLELLLLASSLIVEFRSLRVEPLS